MSQSKDICNLCGKPSQNSFNGSLTQWVSLCRCELVTSSGVSDNTIQICLKCEKRIGVGRVGTFTQWIFRSDICSCPDPSPVAKSIKNLSDGEFQKVFVDLSSIVEVEVDKSRFPVDRFVPIEIISSTFNSTIYLSIDKLLGTRVAIKSIILERPEDIVNFQREVRALGKLTHPGLVKVLDFAEKNGTPYMVMEYVDGVSLRHFISFNSKLTVEDTLQVVASLCETLTYCHSKNILHRDVKPENILISNSTEPLELKLVDFGLACTIDTISNQNKTIAGTPLYMAPDTSNGFSYDVRSEIYSLGCIMFELLTGSPPYKDDNPLALLKLHADAEIPTLASRSQAEGFDSQLESIVSKCLAKSPGDRFQSMDELRSSINEFMGGVLDVQNLDLGESSKKLTGESVFPAKRFSRSIASYLVLSGIGFILICILLLGSDHDVQSLLGLAGSKHSKNRERVAALPLDFRVMHANVIGMVGGSTTEFNFSGPDLSDDQLDHLIVASPRVRNFGLDNCSGITVKGLVHYFKSVSLEEVTLANKSCAPEFIKTLVYNQNMRRLILENVDKEDLAAIPHEMPSLNEVVIMDSKLGGLQLQNLKAITNLYSLIFKRCSNFVGSLKQLNQLKVNALDLDNCLIQYSDFEHLKNIESLRYLSLRATKFLDVNETISELDNEKESLYGLGSDIDSTVKAPDAVMERISKMPVTVLYFSKYKFTRTGLLKLSKMKKLDSLELDECLVDSEVVETLKEQMPDTYIVISSN